MSGEKINPIILAGEAAAPEGVIFEVNGARYRSSGITETGDVRVTAFNEEGLLDPEAGPTIVRGDVLISNYSNPPKKS